MRRIVHSDLCEGLDASRLRFTVMTFLRNTWEGPQQRIGSRSFSDLEPVPLPTDSGARRARRMLERLIAAERAQDG